MGKIYIQKMAEGYELSFYVAVAALDYVTQNYNAHVTETYKLNSYVISLPIM